MPGPEDADRDPDLATDRSLLCKATYQVEGTLVPKTVALPAGLEGTCEPFGTWQLAVTLEDPGSCKDAAAQMDFAYQVEATPQYRYDITYAGDTAPEASVFRIKAGSNECQGTFEHFSPDGREVLRIKAAVALGGTALHGRAYFERHHEAQP